MSKSTFTPAYEANYIRGLVIKNKKIDVAIRVEGVDDEPFWQAILKEVKPDLRIRVFKESSYYPSDGASGKTSMLSLAPHLSKEFILCIDSDYDYLLQDAEIKNNPFIIQTYADSIENFWCNPKRLNKICCKAAAVETIDFDFERFFTRYSEIVYPLFRISIVEERNRKTGIENNSFFDRKGFASFISMQGFINIAALDVFFDELQERVSDKLSQFAISKDEIDNITELLEGVGVNTESCFWLIRGKNIFSGITLQIMRSVLNRKIAETRRSLTSNAEIAATITVYDNKLEDEEELLRNITDFSDIPFFSKIESDIQAIFN